MSGKVVRVGSRKSQLALVQTEKVVSKLCSEFPKIDFEIVTVTTTGDKVQNKALSKVGGKSLFLKELEVALLENRVDILVHSLKDVPTELAAGLVIGAICEREESGDALVIKKGFQATSLSSLPKGSVVGTSSMRRTAQLAKNFSHLKIVDVRGNLNTRLAKLDDEEGSYDALVLASAGLIRLGWHDRIAQKLDSADVMYAVGQGAVAVECREDDHEMLEMVSHINHPPTMLACLAERSLIRKLEGGCSVPVAVLTSIENQQLTLRAGVYSMDGKVALEEKMSCELEDVSNGVHQAYLPPITAVVAGGAPLKHRRAAEQLGIAVGQLLIDRGAGELLKDARKVAASLGKLKKGRVV